MVGPAPSEPCPISSRETAEDRCRKGEDGGSRRCRQNRHGRNLRCQARRARKPPPPPAARSQKHSADGVESIPPPTPSPESARRIDGLAFALRGRRKSTSSLGARRDRGGDARGATRLLLRLQRPRRSLRSLPWRRQRQSRPPRRPTSSRRSWPTRTRRPSPSFIEEEVAQQDCSAFLTPRGRAPRRRSVRVSAAAEGGSARRGYFAGHASADADDLAEPVLSYEPRHRPRTRLIRRRAPGRAGEARHRHRRRGARREHRPRRVALPSRRHGAFPCGTKDHRRRPRRRDGARKGAAPLRRAPVSRSRTRRREHRLPVRRRGQFHGVRHDASP